MAAPRKSGLDYFPLDVGIFHDNKMIPLKARYGAAGIITYINLLCKIYGDRGYYVKLDNDFYFIISDEIKVNENTIRQVINFLLERSLFDNKLFQSDKVLTSRSIQKRYQEAVTNRGKKNDVLVESKYWLLEKEETRSFIKFTLFSEGTGNNRVNTGNNHNNYMEKPPKVKESKVKESNITPLPPSGEKEEVHKPEKTNTKQKNNEELTAIWDSHKDRFSEPMRKKILEWIRYKKEKNKEYKPQGLNSLLVQIEKKIELCSESLVIDVIEESMASNYQGILWDKLDRGVNKNNSGTFKKFRNTDAIDGFETEF